MKKLIRAQATLELTVSLILSLMLLFACFKVLLWASRHMVSRQQDYEALREFAGSVGSYIPVIKGIEVPESWSPGRYPDLRLLPEK